MEAKKHVFSPLEKKVFVDIVRKYKKIVENKQTDGSTLKGKNAAWDQITLEYNASSLTLAQASNKQLRRLWMNLRHRQREAMMNKRQHPLTPLPSIEDTVVYPDISVITPDIITESNNKVKKELEDIKHSQYHPANSPPSPPPPPLPTPLPPTSLTSSPVPTLTHLHPILGTNAQEKLEKTYLQTIERNIIEKEYENKQKRASEIHELEIELLKEKLREAKAKADLAELVLQQASKDTPMERRNVE